MMHAGTNSSGTNSMGLSRIGQLAGKARVAPEELAAAREAGGFDEAWYLAEYPDVAMTGIDALEHYLWIGRRLGRLPGPQDGDGQRVAAVVAPGVGAVPGGEAAWAGLRLVVAAPQSDDAPSDAGWAAPVARDAVVAGGGRADVVAPGAAALGGQGKLASVDGYPVLGGEPVSAFARDLAMDPAVYAAVAEGMSAEFYELTYADVAAAGVDPVAHYLQAGWAEGRDPCRAFSTRHYLENNDDVAAAGINPFYHWLVAGRAEGREGRHGLGFRFDMLARLKPVGEQIADMKAQRLPVVLSGAGELCERLRALAADGGVPVLSFSHDDFTAHVGGVQLLLRRELGLLRARGWHQIHVYPAHPLPFVDMSGETVVLGVLIDGVRAGFYRPRDIIEAVRGAGIGGLGAKPARLVIHNLLGHNIDQVLAIIAAFGVSEGHFWLHDYAALYNNYKLLRNDVEYGGLPRAGTMAHALCSYAQADFCHAEAFGRLFAALRLQVVAPSQAAREIWEEAGLHDAASVTVLEHCRLRAVAGSEAAVDAGAIRPLRVGFLGYPAAHKGWEVFAELALRFGDDPRYQFYHLGKGRQGGLPVTYHEVLGDAENPDAMRAAVAELGLDVALVWSIWPETFCLTAYEALAGGAALVSNPDAGNVARVIEAGVAAGGRVLANEMALGEAFARGAIGDLARRTRAGGDQAATYALEYSDLTAHFWFAGEIA